MGMHCQDGLSDPGITAWEIPKVCTSSGAGPGSLSLESADKSNKDMLTDRYYSQSEGSPKLVGEREDPHTL
ncbi:hypothetical protein DUI87_04390 [Hirundo rustica rustica]|uniref:Uncharacterized protein n=1 Tax=Hirundo rustica rustica TaxID=333673 RepID=A0A3M0L0I0_HIRRU|nr:hypothetical protein DUI87_04390 [Hirundo rustica rustica]